MGGWVGVARAAPGIRYSTHLGEHILKVSLIAAHDPVFHFSGLVRLTAVVARVGLVVVRGAQEEVHLHQGRLRLRVAEL